MLQLLNKNKILYLLFIILFLYLFLSKFDVLITDQDKKSEIFFREISSIWELSFTKYYYSDIISYKSNKKFDDINIPFTKKSFLIKYNGVIKSGVNLKDIKIVNNNGKYIKIYLPKSKIIEHYIDDKNVLVYDEKSSLFNKLSINDAFKEISNEKEKVEKEVIADGFLEKSDESTKKFLKTTLNSLGYEKVDIMIR